MNRKANVLWVSLMAPYDKVKHAGGKIENYFLKKLFATNRFNIHLISFATEDIKAEIDLDEYEIPNTIYYYTWQGVRGKVMKLFNAYGKLNVWSKGAGLTSPYYTSKVVSKMKQLKNEGYSPDVIIFQWTEIATMMEEAKKIFPNAKTVMIEEDVSFLGHSRKAAAAAGIRKQFLEYKANRIKSREIELLDAADMIVLNNHKDEKLILNDIRDPKKIWVWCPFYQSMLNHPRKKANKDILFYGALSRQENWKSAVWFLDNVWPHIMDPDARYVMLGSNPPDVLKKYQSDRVIITGFVDDIAPYFENSLCLAAPLVLGAGVKIKVLEGLSSGIPVLTNDIGIEGIPAVDQKDYFHCVTAQDYIQKITDLLNKKVDLKEIETNGKCFMRDNFNFEKDVSSFADKLSQLCD